MLYSEPKATKYKVEIWWKQPDDKKMCRTVLMHNISLQNVGRYFIQQPYENYGTNRVELAVFPTRLMARFARQSVDKYTWCETNDIRYDILKKSIVRVR